MADKASSEERTISWEEIKEHNSKSKSVWVAINNKVYDVTQFMDDVSVRCQRFAYNIQCASVVLHLASWWRGGSSRTSRYSVCIVLPAMCVVTERLSIT